MREHDKYYTDLDMQLQQLALIDWATFVQLVGEDSIMAAKVCVLRKQGKSLGQIAAKFNKSKGGVQYTNDNKCKCTPNYINKI